MGIQCTLQHFIENYGGTPDFNPDEYNYENIDSIGIEGMVIKVSENTGYIVRLFWYRGFNQLGVEYEDTTPLAQRPTPMIQSIPNS